MITLSWFFAKKNTITLSLSYIQPMTAILLTNPPSDRTMTNDFTLETNDLVTNLEIMTTFMLDLYCVRFVVRRITTITTYFNK